MGKLTFLAFMFVALSFTTSFFGMNVNELKGGTLGIKYWGALSILVLGAALAMIYLDLIGASLMLWRKCGIKVR